MVPADAFGEEPRGEPDATRDIDKVYSLEELEELNNKDYLFGSCRRALLLAKKRGGAVDSRFYKKATRICNRNALWARQEEEIESSTRGFRGALAGARDGRCKTAICWGPSHRWGLEPLAEFPIGKSVALPGSGLGRFINNNGVDVRMNGGLRFWFAWDWVSVAIYLSTPSFSTGKETLRIRSSGFEYPVSQTRRPLPGVAVGLFADTLWIGFDYNQLRNGSTQTTRDPNFPESEVVSHALSITIAIAPIAGLRNGLGSLKEANRRASEADDAAAKAEESAASAKKSESTAAGYANTAATAASLANDAKARIETLPTKTYGPQEPPTSSDEQLLQPSAPTDEDATGQDPDPKDMDSL